MTGRDLIIYILSNNLEDEPVFKDGKIIGFLTVHEAAAKMNVGVETVRVLIQQDRLKHIKIGETYLVSVDCELTIPNN